MEALESIAGVAEVAVVHGTAADPSAPPALLIEIPHGATRAVHFEALRDALRGPFAPDLGDFFFVNTDVGAPEVGLRLAERVTAAAPKTIAAVIRCLLPRTFIDCNRLIDAPRAAASAAGEVTPGIAPYVTDASDLAWLFDRYAAYRALATRAYEAVCGGGGFGLMLHTYAPRSIDVAVDGRIVERLRAEYRPEAIGRWPLRAEVDLITRDPGGARLAADDVVDAMRAACGRAGLGCAEGEAYALHPATLGHAFASRWPGRTLCVELRRDLLVREFTPFSEMDVDPEKADRLAAALAEGLRAVASLR
jgi:hypothetical protein